MEARVAWPPTGKFALADCLAADDLDDTLVCIGGDGDAKTVATYSASNGEDLCLLGHRKPVRNDPATPQPRRMCMDASHPPHLAPLHSTPVTMVQGHSDRPPSRLPSARPTRSARWL